MASTLPIKTRISKNQSVAQCYTHWRVKLERRVLAVCTVCVFIIGISRLCTANLAITSHTCSWYACHWCGKNLQRMQESIIHTAIIYWLLVSFAEKLKRWMIQRTHDQIINLGSLGSTVQPLLKDRHKYILYRMGITNTITITSLVIPRPNRD